VVNAIHREIEKLERKSDDNAAAIRDLIAMQDGSEVRDLELQDAMLLQDRMADCREALETFREGAAEAFATATGEPWLPRSGNRTGHGVTAAQMDARAMLKAARDKRDADLNPDGPRYVVAGHKDWTDVGTVFAKLDALHSRKPDMVLVTKGGPGVELVARKWAARVDLEKSGITTARLRAQEQAMIAAEAAGRGSLRRLDSPALAGRVVARAARWSATQGHAWTEDRRTDRKGARRP
jgi:hypothetical protein